MHSKLIDQLIDLAITEDIGDGDHTSLACIPATATGGAKLIIKDEGILSGVDIALKVFGKIDPSLAVEVFLKDGAAIFPGDEAFTVNGPVRSILRSERLVLNFMQRMSGIASVTHLYASKLEGLKTKILDTRKTTPGLRLIEKLAVRTGGGCNHRTGLFDMILIKDNHIDFAGGIGKAIAAVQDYLARNTLNLKIEIEARTLDDIKEILETGNVHRIMLDNFSIGDTRLALEMINGRYETESSGRITIDNIRDYAECGVDYISVGALTHQIKSLDMSLKACDF
ncbi:MAG: carboxylating nicotinate-nucleotide diphosphorylase [Bacteroidales bacterium]|nr:carboxylating nicotinate-nucleotide diphosphorylase [Bacteroidales bacterium]